ncbi:Late embryogenesis abundant protein, LEA-14 [Spatholobus suberectus]|nr:Late embryogenesis abundant protein, LEA-14 [Spatholobus suberectus]
MNTRANSQAQPSPGQHHLYYANPTPGSHSCSRGCCCCLFLLFSFVALLLLAAVLVTVLAIKPKRPHLDLRQVGLQYMAIAPRPNHPGPGTANVYLIIRLAFAMVNPNRVGIRCGESRVTLLYRGNPLGRTSVPPFCQHPHTVKEVAATVDVDDVNLSNADAADFTRDALLNDRVELRVLAHVATKIRLFNLQSPPLQAIKEFTQKLINWKGVGRFQKGYQMKMFNNLSEFCKIVSILMMYSTTQWIAEVFLSFFFYPIRLRCCQL